MRFLVLAVLVGTAFAAPARAQVERFALVIGNDQGAADEPSLRYAEQDARNVSEVLFELGDVRPENLTLALGQDANSVRRSLIALNARIRGAERDSVLFVYYSGHSDARALHLGGSSLPVEELRQLVRGSSASFRVLIVDSCRSGAVTRAKGGRARRPYSITMDRRLSASGLVFLTSSAVDEDAQESEALRGSIFTHYLLSALLGAGDEDSDGNVDVAEAYRYAYANTLRESSRSLGTLQHPTYRYDYGGHGPLVLTSPGARDRRRGFVVVPPGRTVLIMRGDADGDVIAEVGMHERARTLSLRAGSYFVVARAPTELLEGPLTVTAGRRTAIDPELLARVEYARLVRRGGTELTTSSFVTLGYRMRTSIHDGEALCHGASLTYGLDLSAFTLGARLSACRASFTSEYVRGDSDELSLTLRADRFLDIGPSAVFLGVEVGLSALLQTFETRGRAPDRTALAPSVGAHVGLTIDVLPELLVLFDVAATTTFLTLEDAGQERLHAAFAVQGTLGAGLRF